MGRIKYREWEIRLMESEPEGWAYLEYNEVVGGEPLGLTVPYGYPEGVEEKGGVIAVYKECIREGKAWEELLGVKPLPDDVDI